MFRISEHTYMYVCVQYMYVQRFCLDIICGWCKHYSIIVPVHVQSWFNVQYMAS